MIDPKVGDVVRRINNANGGMDKGDTGVISYVRNNSDVDVRLDKNEKISVSHDPMNLELVTNNKSFMTNLTEKFANLFVKEPQKSLRKAGIFDNNDMPTVDGQKIYLAYLIAKDTQFKTDIVDPIVAQIEK